MADGRRAPAIMTAALLAICMAAGPGATGAMADGAPTAAARDGAAAVADTKYSIEDLKDVKVVWEDFSGPDTTTITCNDANPHSGHARDGTGPPPQPEGR